VQKCANSWEAIHADGQGALLEAKARVRKIKRGLDWVKAQIEQGKPLPDCLSAQNSDQPQNA
jgi:hypothetical protein